MGVTLRRRGVLFNWKLKLVENSDRGRSSCAIPGRLLILALLFLALPIPSRAAETDLSRLRAQLALAEEAEDKPAIVELGRRIVAEMPGDFATWEKIARTQVEIEDFERCAETLDAWQRTVKQSPAAIENFRGDLSAHAKKYVEAERHWLAFLARKPAATDAADVYDKLADACVEQGRWKENAAYRAKAVAADDSAERRVTHATALMRLRLWEAAYAEMAKANKIDSTDAEVKEWLPQFERLAKLLPRIKAIDARITKSPNDAGLLLDRARLFTVAERPLLALEDCERAMKMDPASVRARIQTGEALQDAGRPEDAAKLQVSTALLRGEDKHVSEQALRDLGAEDARINENPDDAALLSARAKTLRGLKQFTLALADAQAALALDEELPVAYFEAAHNFDELGQEREALDCVMRATELNPNDPVYWYYRGILEAKRADFAGAIESQTRSLSIRESVVALREREQCARRLGKIDNANADLNRIRQLEPVKE
jgi:tetratricopeptide (TPR) repeat protein